LVEQISPAHFLFEGDHMFFVIEFLERFCREWRDEQAGKNAQAARASRMYRKIDKLEERVQALEKENHVEPNRNSL
jgi:hypothetical protein